MHQRPDASCGGSFPRRGAPHRDTPIAPGKAPYRIRQGIGSGRVSHRCIHIQPTGTKCFRELNATKNTQGIRIWRETVYERDGESARHSPSVAHTKARWYHPRSVCPGNESSGVDDTPFRCAIAVVSTPGPDRAGIGQSADHAIPDRQCTRHPAPRFGQHGARSRADEPQ